MPTAHPPQPRVRQPGWIAGYDGLRAIAALAVFGVHFHGFVKPFDAALGPLQLERALLNGNTGVALFFMLSAFLLSQPFWDRAGHNAHRLLPRSYALRRAARILPAYYLCLLALVVVGRRFTGEDLTTSLLHTVFLHNFTEFAIYGMNDPFWTIAVQVQFYLLLPVILALLWPLRRKRVPAIVGFVVLSVAAFWVHSRVMHWAEATADWPYDRDVLRRPSRGFVISHSLLAHLPHFLLGIAAGGVYAMLRKNPKPGHSDDPDQSRQTRTASAIPGSSGAEAGPVSGASECPGLGAPDVSQPRGSIACDLLTIISLLAIFAIIATGLDDALRITLPNAPATDIGRYNWPAVPVLIAVVLICTPFTAFTKRLLDIAPLRWLGVISYGFYLYHLPCQKLIERVMATVDMTPREHWIVFAAASLAVAIAVAAVSWFAIERPIIRWAHGGKTRRR